MARGLIEPTQVTFTTKVNLNFGEKIYVVGNHKAVGNNDTRRGRRMDLVDGSYRTMPFEIEPGVNQIEYRYLKVHDATKNEHWETAPKRVLDIAHDAKADIEQVGFFLL